MAATSNPGGTQGLRGSESGAGGVMSSVKEKAQELEASATSRAQDAWETTRQGASQAASAVADRAQSAWDDFNSFLRRYPVAGFCAGIGVGFLLARIMESGGSRIWQSERPYSLSDMGSRQGST